MSKALWIAALCALGATHAVAAELGHPCVAKPDPVERLACYDQAFGAPETQAQVQAATSKAKEEFGLGNAEKRERLGPLVVQSDVDQIEARITELSTTGSGERLLTLDNGQKWLIVERGSRGPMRVDEQISIRKGALGTHRVVTAAGVGLRAKRIR